MIMRQMIIGRILQSSHSVLCLFPYVRFVLHHPQVPSFSVSLRRWVGIHLLKD